MLKAIKLPQRLTTEAARQPQDWDLKRVDGHLVMDGHDLIDLAEQFGTPLHVVSARKLRERCQQFKAAFCNYPEQVVPHFSYKTNQVAGVLQVLHQEGMGAEVVGDYQLWLAQQLAVPPQRILLAGPGKSKALLNAALQSGVRSIILDTLDELDNLTNLAADLDILAPVVLRICPDIRPRGMNASSVSGSRRTHFGFDLRSGEVDNALAKVLRSPHLKLCGVHVHIGSGIHNLRPFRAAAEKSLEVLKRAWDKGATPAMIDLGGGLGTRLAREFTAKEMLAYLGFGRLPRFGQPSSPGLVAAYGAALSETVVSSCEKLDLPLPELVLEPGRVLVSDAQLLLLRVGSVRERPGVGHFAVTDGGAMSVALMLLSEYHAVLLANREAAIKGRTSVFGNVPTAMDVVYRNLPLPRLKAGDVLAVMDAGAYFTSTATNFAGPRPPVVMIDGEKRRLIRRREAYADVAATETVLPLSHSAVKAVSSSALRE